MLINFILLYNKNYIQFVFSIIFSTTYTWLNELTLSEELKLQETYCGRALIKTKNLINKIPYLDIYQRELKQLKNIIFESFKYKLFAKENNKINDINELLDKALVNLSPSERITLMNNDIMKKYREDLLKLSLVNKNKNLDSVFTKIFKLI
jgi:hypothetical protein